MNIRSFSSVLFSVVAIMVFGTTAHAVELKWVGCGISKTAFMDAVSKAYKEKTGVTITLEGAEATRGIEDVSAGKADLGGTCRHVLMRPEEKGVKLIPVGWDALTVITHKTNPVETVSLDQVKKIFSGEITSWKQVGGPDQHIQVFAREGKISGVGRMARELMFKNPNQDYTPQAKLFDNSGPLEKAVEQTPWAIGVTGVSSARKRSAKVLKLEGKDTSYENIANGHYMLYRPLYLVTSQKPSPEVKKFVAFILSEEGQALIRKEGTVTLKDGGSLWSRYSEEMKQAGITPGTF